jgi:hypothetical protein
MEELLEEVFSMGSVPKAYKGPRNGFSDRKSKVLVEGEFSTPRNIAAGVVEVSVLASILYIIYIYIHCASAEPGTYPSLFADDTCIYATETCNSCSLQTAARPRYGEFVL